MINILLLSCGTRNKIVQYFRENVKRYGGIVVAADCSELAPALYEADKYYIIKKINENGYIEQIYGICAKEEIKGILSLIDPELSMLAKHKRKFEEMGTKVIGSPYMVCKLAQNKFEMYQWMEKHSYKCAKSFADLSFFYDEIEKKRIDFPVLVKPIHGSASIGIVEAKDQETVNLLMSHGTDFMIQEYINGKEIGADVYIDMISGEVVSIFLKKKLKMKAGETDKAISFKDQKLFRLIEKFAADAGYRGPIDIDMFEVDGQYFISEVNPRFGGGYPHAYESGCNYMRLILENLTGRVNQKVIGKYAEKVVMMKYSEVKIRQN